MVAATADIIATNIFTVMSFITVIGFITTMISCSIMFIIAIIIFANYFGVSSEPKYVG